MCLCVGSLCVCCVFVSVSINAVYFTVVPVPLYVGRCVRKKECLQTAEGSVCVFLRPTLTVACNGRTVFVCVVLCVLLHFDC
jgi:hypothetical protein